jgi:hypothetical protein
LTVKSSVKENGSRKDRGASLLVLLMALAVLLIRVVLVGSGTCTGRAAAAAPTASLLPGHSRREDRIARPFQRRK